MKGRFVFLPTLFLLAATLCHAQSRFENDGLAWMRGTGGGAINQIIAHPDGKHLIIAQSNVQIFDLKTGSVVKMLYGPDDGLDEIDMTADGATLVTAGGYDIVLWETETWTERGRMRVNSFITAVAVSGDGRYVAVGELTNRVVVWDWERKEAIREYRVKMEDSTDLRHMINELHFLPQSDTLIAYSAIDGSIMAWDVGRDDTVWAYTPPSISGRGASHFTLSPDGRYMAFDLIDDRIIQVDIANGFDTSTVVRLRYGHVARLAYSPRSEVLTTVVGSRLIYMWETATFGDSVSSDKIPPIGEALVITPEAMSYSRDGRLLYVGNGQLGDIMEFDVEAGRLTRFLGEYWNYLRSLTWSPDGTMLVASAGDISFVHDASSGSQGQVLAALEYGRLNRCESMAFSSDGTKLAAGCNDSLRIWTTGIWERWPISAAIDTFRIGDILWTQDHSSIAVRTPRHVWMYDVSTDTALIHFEYDSILNDITFSPNDKHLLGVSHDGTVRVWETSSGRLIHVLDDHEPNVPVLDIAMPSSGDRFATGNIAGEILVWNSESLTPERRMVHEGGINELDITPDGGHVLSGGHDGLIIIWDAATGDSVGAYYEQPYLIIEMEISPDGRYVAWGSWDGLFVYHARWKQSGVEHDVRRGADGLRLGAITPNPARDHAALAFTIAGTAGRAVPVRVELFDERGERLAVVTDEMVEPGAHSARLETAGLPSGAYVVRVTSGELSVSGMVRVVR